MGIILSFTAVFQFHINIQNGLFSISQSWKRNWRITARNCGRQKYLSASDFSEIYSEKNARKIDKIFLHILRRLAVFLQKCIIFKDLSNFNGQQLFLGRFAPKNDQFFCHKLNAKTPNINAIKICLSDFVRRKVPPPVLLVAGNKFPLSPSIWTKLHIQYQAQGCWDVWLVIGSIFRISCVSCLCRFVSCFDIWPINLQLSKKLGFGQASCDES